MYIYNLKKAREAVHLTQSQVAEKLSISDGSYKNYEQGKREPNNALLCKIAELFHVTTDYLLGRDTGEPEPMEQLAGQFNMSALEQKILDNYLSLPDDMRCDFMEFLKQSVREVEEEAKSGE